MEGICIFSKQNLGILKLKKKKIKKKERRYIRYIQILSPGLELVTYISTVPFKSFLK